MATEEHDHEIKIKGGSFELSDLGHLMPGMAEIMPLIGERIWKCYYAAQAHNRKLAGFQLKEAVNLMQKGSILRPKYEEDIDSFVAGEVATLQANIEAEDWDAFESNFHAMVDQAEHPAVGAAGLVPRHVDLDGDGAGRHDGSRHRPSPTQDVQLAAHLLRRVGQHQGHAHTVQDRAPG